MALSDIGSAETIRSLTPSDTEELNPIPRAIRVGTGGDVKVTASFQTDAAAVVIVNVQDGEYLPVAVKRLWATGTTATDFLGLY